MSLGQSSGVTIVSAQRVTRSAAGSLDRTPVVSDSAASSGLPQRQSQLMKWPSKRFGPETLCRAIWAVFIEARPGLGEMGWGKC